MNKVLKEVITAIYGLGVAIVFVLLVSVIFRIHIVLFPNAMLPMELHELASTWLSWGFVPMLFFTILFCKVHHVSQSKHKIRNTILVYLPTIVCLVYALFWIFIAGIGVQ